MTTAAADVMAKRINFTGIRKYIELNYGEEMWGQVLASLPTAARTVWDRALLAGPEHPFSAFKEMINQLNSSLRTTSESETAAIYEFIADQGMSGAKKIFFRMTEPSFVIKNYPGLWSSFFSTGTVDVLSVGRGQAVLRFLLPDIFDDWLQPACLGFSKKAVEMGGGRDLTIQRTAYEKKARGQFEARYELRWKE